MSEKILREVKVVLEALSEKARGASDVVVATRLPRYRVLAYMQLLEALGFIERIYSKGTYRVYSLTDLGRKLLEVLENNLEFRIEVVVEEPRGSEVVVEKVAGNEGIVEAS